MGTHLLLGCRKKRLNTTLNIMGHFIFFVIVALIKPIFIVGLSEEARFEEEDRQVNAVVRISNRKWRETNQQLS